MKKCFKGILILSIVLISRTGALSQLYGNEWIDYNKSYYKISVADEGIYRLEFQDFVDAGIPVNAIDGRKYQIFIGGSNRRFLSRTLELSNWNQGTIWNSMEIGMTGLWTHCYTNHILLSLINTTIFILTQLLFF